MGTVVWLKSIRIEVRSREAHHKGRPHCHAVVRDCDVSIDLNTLEVLGCAGFTQAEVAQISLRVNEYREDLLAKWEEYHGKNKD